MGWGQHWEIYAWLKPPPKKEGGSVFFKKNTQSFDDGGEMEEQKEKNVSNVHKMSQRARDFSFELNCSEVAPPKYVGKKIQLM